MFKDYLTKVDRDFMDKDVSQLTKGGYYLFYSSEVQDTIVQCIYKDGVIFRGISSKDDYSKGDGMYGMFREHYVSGTLKEWLDNDKSCE